MLTQAQQSDDRAHAIVGSKTQSMSDNVKAYLPRIDSIKRGIRRLREGNNLPAPGRDDMDFDIPNDYAILIDGRQFLQYDNGNGEARILIYGTAAGLSFLTNSPDWFMDGTFKVAPPQFAQLYTVHGLKEGHHVIGCYALLPNKQTETYVEFLQQVEQLTSAASPESIMIDFEQACINAVSQVFPQSTLVGCLFHLCKSIHRHVKSSGFQQEYLENEEFRTHIRMISALAFVPLEDIITAFNALSDICHGNETTILDYFEINYIGELRRGRRRRRNPLFAHQL